ncbi:hypothetical protein [Litoribrevibacter albus]|uniref:Uncharacterized protein n=1 Tax=Litoribrevibacter albus TaxID=1473156 RepID=A0AA37S8B4_9GAMM|nr:hypothetical protein [Litoribrevibacter albus]GLQ30915.1 hypothetical protein GCM10007876_13940 [Litoribrevibacter albus]
MRWIMVILLSISAAKADMKVIESRGYPLANDNSNRDVFEWLENNDLSMVNLSDGTPLKLSDINNETMIILGSDWEPSTASTIGKSRNSNRSLIVIYVEQANENIKEAKKDSWFFKHIYELSGDSIKLKSMFHEIPIQIMVDSNGKITSIIDGV